MGKMKHVIAIIIVLVVLIGGFIYLLPRLPELQAAIGGKVQSSTTDSSKVVDPAQETLSFEEKMKLALEPLEVSYSKRKKREIWTMSGGKTIITYLLQTQRFVNKAGGKILYMEELYNNAEVFQSAIVDLLKDNGDTLNIEIQVSRSEFKPGASMLAVAFTVTNLTPELIVGLNQLDYPYDLLVPPFGPSNDFFSDLKKVKNKEIILWMTMESVNLNKVHNKLRPLRIHHTEEQIESVIDEAYKKLPEAKGIASRHGEQAVEHRQLLQAILKPAQERHLWFMDISMNKLSIVPQTCKAMEMTCKTADPYDPAHQTLGEFVVKKLRATKNSGLSAMILPLDQNSLNKLSGLSEKAKAQGTKLVNLSTFMKK